MASFLVKKWHINRLSGNHKQGDYKKTTEYLDKHTVNKVYLMCAKQNAYLDNALIESAELFFTYEDYIKMQPIITNAIINMQCIYESGIQLVTPYRCTTTHVFSSNNLYLWKFVTIDDSNFLYDIMFYRPNRLGHNYLITIGTGDLELVVDEVEEMDMV